MAEVDGLVESFKATPQDIGTYIEPETIEELMTRKRHDLRQVPVPDDIPIRIGEALYNLRCALDYLIFALAWHDSGIEPTGRRARRLQFPIESDIKDFEGRRSRTLDGVSDPHVAMVREYQPAEGCLWTGVLADLNDSDKHRHLAVLGGSFDHETGTWVSRRDPDPDAVPDEQGRYAMEEMSMDDYATLDVVFPDGRLVAETLQELETEVRALLLRFGPEFKLRPV